MPTDMFGRSPSNVRPTAIVHWPTRISPAGRDLGHGQRLVGVDLQQHDHPVVVGGHEPGRLARAVGQLHEDRGRAVDEVERAGDDVAVGDRRPGRWSGPVPNSTSPDPLQAADGLDAHDRRGDAVDGRAEGLLFERAEVVVGGEANAASQRATGRQVPGASGRGGRRRAKRR